MSLASARKLWRSGEPFIWLTGGALALALIMVGGLIGIILANALGFFWPAAIVRLTLGDGKALAGSVVERERCAYHFEVTLPSEVTAARCCDNPI